MRGLTVALGAELAAIAAPRRGIPATEPPLQSPRTGKNRIAPPAHIPSFLPSYRTLRSPR